MHYAAPRVYATVVSQSEVQTSSAFVPEVITMSLQKCRFARYIRHAVPQAVEHAVVKKKNMDVSHPGFKCTPSAPDAT